MAKMEWERGGKMVNWARCERCGMAEEWEDLRKWEIWREEYLGFPCAVIADYMVCDVCFGILAEIMANDNQLANI